MTTSTLTLVESLSAGYTHFWFSHPENDMTDQFCVYELSKEKLEWARKRCTDVEFDLEESTEDMENHFGLVTMLCAKADYPQVTAEEISKKISDIFEDDDRYVPASIQSMSEHLKDEEKFKEGIALINEALKQYRSFTDAGILVVLD